MLACKRKIEELEKQLAIKKSKQLEDMLTENFHQALGMNSFPFPNRRTILSQNNNQQQEQKQQNRQQTKLSAKTRREQYQANKKAGLPYLV